MKTSEELPIVSVVITTYNRKKLLNKTIDSILNQTFKDFELIVVDNFSNYDFFSFIESFNDKRITPFQNKNNGIIAVNRNYGIKKAKGEYIAFCDDDDLWKKQKLESQLRHFENSEIIGVGACSIKIGNLQYHRQKSMRTDLLLDFRGLLFQQRAALSSLMVRNTGFLFEEREDFKFVEDIDFQLGLSLKTGKKIKILAQPLIYYRIHPGNNASELRNGENVFSVLSKYRNRISETEFNQRCARSYMNIGIKALRLNSPEASKYFQKVIQSENGRGWYIAHIFKAFAELPRTFRDKIFMGYYKLRGLLFNMRQ